MGKVEGGSVVALTGASGLVGSHIFKALLENGFVVRAVVRNKDDNAKVGHLKQIAEELGKSDKVSFFSGDLLIANSHDEAFTGCDAVVHTAAVVKMGTTKNTQRDIVDPAVLGTRNVIASIKKCPTIKRLVFTSSVSAVMWAYGKPLDYVFTESDYNEWATIRTDPYGFAKTEAEKIAMEADATRTFDVVSINPSMVIGKCFSKAQVTSSSLFVLDALIRNRKMGNFNASYVDATDVAIAHVRALTTESASGKRYIVISDSPSLSLWELAAVAQPVFPDLVLEFKPLVGKFGWAVCKALGVVTPLEISLVERKLIFSNQRAKDELNMTFTPLSNSFREAISSIVDSGYVKPRVRAK